METSGQIKLGFTAVQDEQLVEMIQMHPYLYDIKHSQHNDHSTREAAWQEISEILERQAEDCKRRWKNIKDAHRRRQKLSKFATAPKSSLVKSLSFLGNAPRRKSKSSNLKTPGSNIVVKTEKEGQRSASVVNFEYEDDSVDQNSNNEVVSDCEVTMESPDPLSTLEKTFQQENEKSNHSFSNLNENTLNISTEDIKMLKSIVEKQEDSTDLFFRSLCMSVKNLPPKLIHEAKIKMLQIVIDLEKHNNYS